RSVTCRREIERELVGYAHPVKLMKAAASATNFEVVEDEDGLRNHDEASCAIRRGDRIHPVEFVRDTASP
ncbi:MAG TPA: hypothetical protein VJ837_00030, partial [Candidatus Paceibacterota bacterium]|nr:hypothetical protein [Candidatus Paceibacterota bacterium]